jgi:serine/threonine-protein kinase RsbW
VVRLSIPAQLAYRDLALSAVLTAVDAEAERPHAEWRDEITSALNEAFNNVVLHAYRGIQGGRVDLSASVHAGEVEVQLSDRGRGFDPASVAAYVEPREDVDSLDIAALPESGMGLFIIRSFMDEVTYTRGAHGKPNVLVLRKRWPAAGAVPPASHEAATKKETSQSGWRMRSVAVPSEASALRTAGSLKRT